MAIDSNLIIIAASSVLTTVVGAFLGYLYGRKKAYLSVVINDKVKAYEEISSQLEKHFQRFYKINLAMIMKTIVTWSSDFEKEITVQRKPYLFLFNSLSDYEKEDISRFLQASHELSDLISNNAAMVNTSFFRPQMPTFHRLGTCQIQNTSQKSGM